MSITEWGISVCKAKMSGDGVWRLWYDRSVDHTRNMAPRQRKWNDKKNSFLFPQRCWLSELTVWKPINPPSQSAFLVECNGRTAGFHSGWNHLSVQLLKSQCLRYTSMTANSSTLFVLQWQADHCDSHRACHFAAWGTDYSAMPSPSISHCFCIPVPIAVSQKWFPHNGLGHVNSMFCGRWEPWEKHH